MFCRFLQTIISLTEDIGVTAQLQFRFQVSGKFSEDFQHFSSYVDVAQFGASFYNKSNTLNVTRGLYWRCCCDLLTEYHRSFCSLASGLNILDFPETWSNAPTDWCSKSDQDHFFFLFTQLQLRASLGPVSQKHSCKYRHKLAQITPKSQHQKNTESLLLLH